LLSLDADGRLELFLVGSDNQLYHRWQTAPNSSQWSEGWQLLQLLGGQWPLSSNTTIARNADGRLELFIVGSDGRVYHKWQVVRPWNPDHTILE
jgi:hypothetical protein